MTTAQAVGAVSREAAEWYAINWQAINRNVRRLQVRIVQATKASRWGRVRALQRLLTLCLAKTKSGYEINNLHRCRVTCYMDEDRLVRSLAKNNPALSRFLDIIAPSDTMKREPDPLLEA